MAKKYIIPGAALIASSYISVLFAIGAIIGYLGIRLFDKKFVQTGKVEEFTIDFGNWQIHVHHWISGSLAIAALCLMSILSPLSIFGIGTLGGLVFHDIHTDKKWYRVIYRK